MSENRIERKPRLLLKAALVVASGELALVGCSSTEQQPAEPATTATTLTTLEQTTTTTEKPVPITFDDLDGGSPIIQVYPGTGESGNDTVSNGTFRDGQTADAYCKTEGRVVTSDINVGEQARSSNEWIRLAGTPTTQFATVVYIQNPDQVLAQLPQC